jgi:hypothetical protein
MASVATAIHALERRTMDKVTWRLVPFLIVCYFIAFVDRVKRRLCQRHDEQRSGPQRGGVWRRGGSP